MYRIINTLEGTRIPLIINNKFFFKKYNKKERKSFIVQLDEKFNVLWQSPEERVYGYKIINERLIYTLQDFSKRDTAIKLLSRPLDDLDHLIYQEEILTQLSEGSIMNNLLIQRNKNESQLNLYNLYKGKLHKRYRIEDVSNGGYRFLQNKILREYNEDSVLEILDLNFNLLWQRDFSEECKYIDTWDEKEYSGSVQHIYPYGEDKIIVCCKLSYCFCLDVNTGKEIWKNEFSSWMTFDYDNHIGYSYSNGGSLAKIDLKTGNILNEDGKYYNLPDLPEYKGYHISSNTGTIVFHEGLLWALVYSNGFSFVAAINPHDWHYEWIHRVDTIGKLMDIKFHKNRMYLHDSEGDLHIYEKE